MSPLLSGSCVFDPGPDQDDASGDNQVVGAARRTGVAPSGS